MAQFNAMLNKLPLPLVGPKERVSVTSRLENVENPRCTGLISEQKGQMLVEIALILLVKSVYTKNV
jgi:hypothetical protein